MLILNSEDIVNVLIACGWALLLVIIIGLVLMWQLVKLFFEIGERYFIVAFLTMMAPLAFAAGGSKNTAESWAFPTARPFSVCRS